MFRTLLSVNTLAVLTLVLTGCSANSVTTIEEQPQPIDEETGSSHSALTRFLNMAEEVGTSADIVILNEGESL